MPVSKEWAFDRSFLRKVYNREVYEYFKDLTTDDFEDIDVPRKAAFRACLILAKSSQLTALQKQYNFRYLVQRVQDRPEVYGMPVQEAQQLFKFKPQIQLFFKQDADATPENYRPIEGEISFRLMNETSTTITELELKNYATRINQEFNTTAQEQIWKKGKFKIHYFDPENGLDLRLLCLNESEGIELVKRVCRIAQTSYNDDFCTPIAPKRNSQNISSTTIILGETKKNPRWRPTGNVRFRYALALIHGLTRAVPLVDNSGRYPNAFF